MERQIILLEKGYSEYQSNENSKAMARVFRAYESTFRYEATSIEQIDLEDMEARLWLSNGVMIKCGGMDYDSTDAKYFAKNIDGNLTEFDSYEDALINLHNCKVWKKMEMYGEF